MNLTPLVDITPAKIFHAQQGLTSGVSGGTYIDTRDYEGPAVIACSHSVAGGTITSNTVEFFTGAASNGTGAVTTGLVSTGALTGATMNLIQLGDIGDWGRYLGCWIIVQGSSTPLVDLCAVLIAQKKRV